MKAVILCGGKGTRLREETEVRPKPMVQIGNRPVLWHIMKIYAAYGFKDFVICLGYKGNMIKEYFLNYEMMNNDFTIQLGNFESIQVHSNHEEADWTVTLADTGEETQTGGRVKKIEKYIDEDTFMLTYGDGVADINIKELLKFHKSHGKIGTMTAVHPPSRFGELTIEGDQVTEFTEKPQTKEGLISGGFFVLNTEFFEYLTDDDSCILEKEPLEKLAADGELMIYSNKKFWQCVDTYRELELLNNLWKNANPPWKVW
ncbi:MAG: glucose-1-phosphate cytidylyltransferase [Methanobacterium sp.]|uniref:glucose-1-phosphate cytidylyltransferase n=1 Tax=Methanobacterium sp. TaxID=2164 RepID=UPI003D6543A3|nr:glucose-1-phosphate cytidylyltransferase [Methanobacterium sp.]